MMRTLFATSILLLMVSACEGGSDGAGTTPTEADALRITPLALDPTPTLRPGLAEATGVPFPTPGPSATPTPTPSPSPTPLPAERIALGQRRLSEQNYEAAAEHFEVGLSAPGALEREQQQSALYGLGLAYLREDRFGEAVDALRSFLALDNGSGSGPEISAPASDNGLASATFHLGRAYLGVDDCPAAIEAFQTFLSADRDLAAYVQPQIAECYLQMGDTAAAITAYEAAAEAPSHSSQEMETRQSLAGLYVEREEYDLAIAQYDAVLQVAEDEEVQGRMTYLAGSAAMLAGDEQAAYEWYRRGVQEYPRSSGAYQGLVQLVDAGVTVDLFQRGLVDYYAEAFEPAVAALEAYFQVQSTDYNPEAHLYLGRSYAALGNLEAALAQLDAYAKFGADEESAPYAAEAGVERGRLLAQAGRLEEAITAYLGLVETEPDSEEAQSAAWWAAVLAVRLEDEVRARELYRQFAELFPGHEDAPQALFRAGFLAWHNQDEAAAVEIWRQLTDQYVESDFGAAGLIWLMRTLPESEAEAVVVSATNVSGAGYYQLRAPEVAREEEPFRELEGLNLAASESDELAEAEAWLAQQLESEDGVSADLSPDMAEDGRLIRGEKLWQLGLYEEAKRELESLRVEYGSDALASLRLAIFFRDLGLYRSSILATESLLRSVGQNVFQAPRLIGRLAYPTYYADLILPLADEYGYDPLLQFALVRQESLFESFIASYAGAQGLSQVMPATGQDIAQRLGWEDYSTEDLHRPHVGLAFGAYYLSEQLKTFDGNVYAALSAYNAGPGNAARWHAQAPDDPDLYLETVDYPETRLYIRRIYTGYAVYRHLYGAE